MLRTLAACLITNAHYTGIYPNDIIANGGLLGDILFFAVSGYCLFNIKLLFFKWYAKRLWRIFLPVWIGTAILLLIGGYVLEEMSLFEWFIYPTYYHFVASIIVLYIPFYIIMRVDFLKEHLSTVMLGIALIMLLIYFFMYDKSYYHIDTVREPFIRFLFLESMLLGAYFRKNTERYINVISWKNIFSIPLFFVIYLVTKLAFSKVDSISEFQILGQVAIFSLLWAIFRFFIGFEERFEYAPKVLKSVTKFIADITLEIYIVQYVIIEVLRPFFTFPTNWIIITASIIFFAFILRLVCDVIYKFINKFFQRKGNKNEVACNRRSTT